MGGTTPGTQYGQLTVHSKATLAGSLRPRSPRLFPPVLGQSLPIIPFGTLSGQFAAVTGLRSHGPVSLAASTARQASRSPRSRARARRSPLRPTRSPASNGHVHHQGSACSATDRHADRHGHISGRHDKAGNGHAPRRASDVFPELAAISSDCTRSPPPTAATRASAAAPRIALSQEVQGRDQHAVVPSVNPAIYSQALSLP